MKDRLDTIRQKGAECRQNIPRWFIVLTIVLSLVVAPAAAQTITESWEDTFEDQSTEGWQGENIQISQTAADGNYSLYTHDPVSTQDDNPEWVDGPVLDLQEPFTVQGTSRINQGTGNGRAGFGIVRGGESGRAEGVILLFSGEYGSTFIAEWNGENPDANNLEQINTAYDSQWVHWEFRSDGDGTVQAKVWNTTEAEPDSYQISRDMEPDSGSFSIFVGTADENREVWLDSVMIEGQEATDPRLSIDAENYMKHGTSQPYRVLWEENTTGIANETTDVTDNATVRSLNTSVITVNNQTNELVATNDTSVAQRVGIRAQYNGSVAYQEVTVASADVENLEVLPTFWRFSASIGSPTIQAILVAVFFGVFAGRIAGGFAGLGLMQLVMVAGWFIGYVDVGMAMISLFTALFIGLNMAANIDYTVSRG